MSNNQTNKLMKKTFREIKKNYLHLLKQDDGYGNDDLDAAKAEYIAYIITHPLEFHRNSIEGEIVRQYNRMQTELPNDYNTYMSNQRSNNLKKR